MAIEREFKFVLNNSAQIEALLKANVAEWGLTVYEINQAYVGEEGRLRSRLAHFRDGQPTIDENIEYIFTWKHKLSNRPGSLELEMPMSSEDFKLAWHEESKNQLHKIRYVLSCSMGEVWEIDIFKKAGRTYFAMAECEVQPDQNAPKQILPIVQHNLLFAVPETDKRFKNRRLANPKKVKKLVEDVLKEIANVTP